MVKCPKCGGSKLRESEKGAWPLTFFNLSCIICGFGINIFSCADMNYQDRTDAYLDYFKAKKKGG